MCTSSKNISKGEAAGGLPGTCPGCPFNVDLTAQAEYVYNTGCLPDPYDIIVMKKETGQNWACHENESKICAGLCHLAKDKGLDLTTGGLISPEVWQVDGQDVAIAKAVQQGR